MKKTLQEMTYPELIAEFEQADGQRRHEILVENARRCDLANAARAEQAAAPATDDAEWAAKILGTHGDTEDQHVAADDLLCDLLSSLGYRQTVEAFCKLDKWYG